MLSKIILPDFITLSVYTILVTYYFYGLFGLIYLLGSTSVLILCGIMYWYELSPDDIKQHMIKYVESDPESVEVNKQITQYNQFVNKQISFVFQKIYLTESNLNTINRYYNHICSYFPMINKYYTLTSSYYDNICSATYGYMKQLRIITSDIPIIKNIYFVYDKLIVNIMNIETLRLFHKLSRNMQNAMNSLEASDKKTSKDNNNVSDSFGDSLETFFSNMKPEEMESIMKQVLTSDMFNNMDKLDDQIEPAYAKLNKGKNK